MQNIWKSVSFALCAMLVGSLLTGVVMSLPRQLQSDALAQQNATAPPITSRGAITSSGASADNSEADRTPTVNHRNLSTAQGLSSAFRNVAEAIRPSVVSISTRTEIVGRARRAGPRGVPPGFEDFFGGRGGQQPLQRRQLTGMGSGVIVRPDGFILTNNHVIKDVDELTVELFDGRTADGKIVGTDPQTDLAVIKIDLPGLQAAPIGSSDDIRVGDWVLAIGSPFGLDQTVTAGIISGKNRVQEIINDGNGFEDFLQTDAAINPGNSGGPLVNLHGELIGINTAILSQSGASAGIGFAIPVSLAQPVLRSIIETGKVRRGFLGAAVDDVTPKAVKDYDLAVSVGALIGGVLEDKPAANAGLQPGDVVTKLDSRKVISGTQLRNYIASRPPGSVVEMEVNRRGTTIKMQVSLLERSVEQMAMFNERGGLFGAKLAPATPEMARKYGYQGLRGGLIVTEIEAGSSAAEAELKVGDVIESAVGTTLKSVGQLSDIFAQRRKRGQPMRCIVRRSEERFILDIR